MKKRLFRIIAVFISLFLLLALVSCGGDEDKKDNGKPGADHTHTPADAVIENKIPATCAYVGCYETVVYCSDCGEELSRESAMIPILEHTPSDALKENVIPPTCEEEGSYDMIVRCTECKAELSKTSEKVPATGHSWVGVECEICGEIIPTSQGLRYQLSADKSYYLVSGIGTCEDTDVVIPPTYEGLPVKEIGSSAFKSNTEIRSITTLGNIEKIGDNAFFGCTSLREIDLGKGIKVIDAYAFFGCTDLYFLEIPDSVTDIGEYAFNGCPHLVSVSLGKGVQNVGTDAFHCGMLLEVKNSSAIEVVPGTSGPGKIAAYALNVYTDTEGESKLTVTSDGFILYLDGENRFLLGYIGEGGEITLPENELGYVIYNSAFIYDNEITGVTIPGSVTEIQDNAFYQCRYITYATVGNSVKKLGGNVFTECNRMESVTLPDGITEIPIGTFRGCSALKNITLPNSISSISQNTFSNCTSLTELKLPAGVTYIGRSAFSGSGLKSIVIPEGVTRVAEYLFSGCTSLTSVTLPDSIETIEFYAFELCTSLREISIPDGVTVIEKCAFSRCYQLTNLDLPNSLTEIGDEAFATCISLRSLIIPVSIKTIGKNLIKDSEKFVSAYYEGYVSDWQTVTLGTGNEKFSAALVYYSENEPTVQGSFWHYENETITLWPALAENTLEYSLSDDGSYYVITGIGTCTDTDIVIPSEYKGLPVKEIGNYAFKDCTQIVTAYIPASITRLGYGAALGCTNLTKLTFEDKNGWELMDGKEATSGTAISSSMFSLQSLWMSYVTESDNYWLRKNV